ncbi:hypothetical protein [Paludisphaera mucosa]|uniref:Uncharacterized protein n=1 Tax=Paludisphaera mucosa TaxID=3030827 RepID=A0ABT6F418_9BACT|nr:hypothetical protein [Paludisphaera mucosa]MDG3002252.1 hypothetical protein [Paludisphaera mucosa]
MASEPRPRLTKVSTFAGADGEPFSFITRIWRKGAARRCTLCPECNRQSLAIFSMCAVVTPGFISDEDAEMHRFTPGDAMPETKVEIREVDPGEPG